MLTEARTGLIVATPGAVNPLRLDETGALIIAGGHAQYLEPAAQKGIFYAASQAATTWSVALTATYTGLVVSNPIGSTVNLIILKAGFALSVAPVAIAHLGFFGGSYSTGIIAHTTPLTPGCTYIGVNRGQGLADAAATLVGTPVWLLPFTGGFTAGALYAAVNAIMNLEGIFVVPPGAYFGIGALTAVIGFGAIIWEEVAI